VNVVETPLPHVNSEWYTPQLPLLELRVKPDPVAIKIISLRDFELYGYGEGQLTIRSSGIRCASTVVVPRHL
jgi:hypothetical protein